MPWHLVTRACFIAAVAWAAALTRPFHPSLAVNLAIGAGLGGLIVFIETRLRSAEVTDLLGALIGGAIGLGLSKTIGAALFWADTSDGRVVFLHSFILLVFPYLGIVMGARKGEWLEPQRLVSLFRDAGPAEALPHPRHQRHHRRPDRRRLRDRLPRRHAGDPAVRAEGAAARRRFRRLAQAQPRPPRPRHPAEDPEDVRRRRHDLRHRLSRGPRSRPQADRARRARCRERSSPTTST